MRRELTLLSGIGAGVALMYMLDPDRGGRRRALARDRVARLANKTPDALNATARDLSNRARGLASEVGSMFRGGEASDEVIVQRVRAAMGRVVSHPHAIRVESNEGRVTLSGNILESEADALLSCAGSARGVREVSNRLTPHAEAGSVPDLQGGRTRPGHRFELMQENWSPAARFLVGAAGGALVLYSLRQKFPVACVLGTIGAGLVARGATNTGLKSMLGADALASLFTSDGVARAGEETGRAATPAGDANTTQPRAGAGENENPAETTATTNPPRARGAAAR
jgi:hypothetical protein